MDWKRKTIQTYDGSAVQLAAYFKGIGARTDDIELGLSLAQAQADARVVEIGCGDGRDAEEIVKKVSWYEGVDPSHGLLEIARKKVPTASFILADALTYNYPTNLDAIFAFASLLHLNKVDIKKALVLAHSALKRGGVYFISLKERDEYAEEVKADQYGERMFYYYNPEIITGLSAGLYEVVYVSHQTIGHTKWFTIALRNK